MKRVFLAEHAIAMPPDVVQGEDAIFNKRIAAAAGTVKAFPCCSYTYNYVLQNAGRLARDPGRYLKGFVTGYREDMIYIEASAERDQWAELKKTVCVNFIIRTGSDCIKLCRNRQLTATNTRLVSQCLLDTEIFAQIRMNDMTDIKGKVYYLLLKHNLWAGFKILSLFKQKE